MKKIIVLLFALLVCQLTPAQKIGKLFKEFKKESGAQYMLLNSKSDFRKAGKFTLNSGVLSVKITDDDGSESSIDEVVDELFESIGVREIEILILDSCGTDVQNRFSERTKQFSPTGFAPLTTIRKNGKWVNVFSKKGKQGELLVMACGDKGCGLIVLRGTPDFLDVFSASMDDNKIEISSDEKPKK